MGFHWLEPRKRNRAPGTVERYEVLCHEDRELHDGPFKTLREAKACAKEYRKRYRHDPIIAKEKLTPLATNHSDPKMRDETYW